MQKILVPLVDSTFILPIYPVRYPPVHTLKPCFVLQKRGYAIPVVLPIISKISIFVIWYYKNF